jgi:hypothetical protein
VKLLHWLAAKCGTTYEAINIWIFCVIWPVISIALVAIIIVQHLRIVELMRR